MVGFTISRIKIMRKFYFRSGEVNIMCKEFYKMSDRVAMLKKNLIEVTPALSAERAKLATEGIMEHPFNPPVLQHAYMLDHILRNMTVFIQDGELIVGNQGDKPRCASVFPEFTSDWILEALDGFETRKCDPMVVTSEDKEILRKYLPMWKGKDFADITATEIPEGSKRLESLGYFSIGNQDSSTGHNLPDYWNILDKGLGAYKAECQKKINEAVITSKAGQEQVDFWKAVIITIDAAGAFAQRFSELAAEKAAQESDPLRKQELLTIAETCAHVPMNPARTFREAVQAVWFIHLIINIESNGHGVSFHRFDQYTNKYYEADLAAGRITEDEAIELLECFFIKITSIMKIRDDFSSEGFAGYPMWQNMIIGGLKPDGTDGTNKVSMLCLKANQAVQTSMPTMSVRWFDGLNKELEDEGVRMIQAGMSTPAFFNDELVVPMVMEKSHCTIEEARNWGIHGCVDPGVAGASDGRPSVGYVNTLKCLELVLYNGWDPVIKEQTGPKTGELKDLDTLEKLQEAFYTQLDYFQERMIRSWNIVSSLHADRAPMAFASMATQGCIEQGKSLQEGGARFHEASCFTVATANTADAIAAIDTLVNREKTIDAETLMEAVKNNWEGYEDIRQMCLKKAPKYGNDNEYVDNIGKGIVRRYAEGLDRFVDSNGGRFVQEVESQSFNVSEGKCVLATPDGRFAYEPVADNVSPAMGRDVNGPTSCVNSVARVDQRNAKAGALFNLRFDPRSIQGEKGRSVISSVIHTYFRNMGEHIQINVVDDVTLRNAQKKPEQYRDLLVRVAGYLAYFTELDSEVQDAVIDRTAHSNV